MARVLNKLTSRGAASVVEPGRHSDGGGLYLVVDPSGARRWLFMYRWSGKQKEMGLGGFDSVPLTRAREMAQAAREALAQGASPLEIKRAEEERPTFGVFADGVVDSLSGQWRNPKHIAQWKMTLTDYAKPIRDVRVDEVTTDHVLKVLKPVWASKPETASRLRGRIERVLDAAKAKGLRSGENPARWKGHLDHLLPKRKILSRGHHTALPVAALPGFMADLRWRQVTRVFADPPERQYWLYPLSLSTFYRMLSGRWPPPQLVVITSALYQSSTFALRCMRR